MKVLITGGAGFIGSHVVKKLVGQGHDVTILDDLSTGHLEALNGIVEDGKLQVVQGDVRDRPVVAKSIRDMDAIVHLAARTSVPLSVEHPVESLDINVNGTTNLLSECATGEVESFVFASSSAVYGEARQLPIPEEHPLNPMSPYASSKVLAEKACTAFRESAGLHAICLRLFNVYGGAVNGDVDPGVIGSFVRRLEKGQSPIIYGDGQQTRDFIHVEDVADAVAYAIEHPSSEGVCNLGTGEAITISELAEKVANASGRRCGVPSYAPARPGDVRHSQADTSRANRLGLASSIFLDEGLQLALNSRKWVTESMASLQE